MSDMVSILHFAFTAYIQILAQQWRDSDYKLAARHVKFGPPIS